MAETNSAAGGGASPAPNIPEGVLNPDTLIFAGSVSLWMGFKTFVVSGLLDIAGIAMAVYGSLNMSAGYGSILLIAGIALLLASSIMMAYAILRIRSQKYRITRRLIEREQGLVFKRVDSLDLGRVQDVELTQSLIERMMNVGTIEVFSTDKVDPDMLIEAIPNPRPVYERLRDAVIELNQRRGVIASN